MTSSPMPSTADFERLRPNLTGHCYRMLGSVFDADDAVQETLVRAWRSLDGFEGRSALSSWLYRIATNVCLDFLAERKRRRQPFDEGSASKYTEDLVQQLEKRPHEEWVEPILDQLVLPEEASPDEKVALRQSTRLAFVAALQQLPGKQRAALLLTEVLGLSAVEAASCLDLSVPALNSALQRARSTLPQREATSPEAVSLSTKESELLERYVRAFEAYDLEALKALLRDDAKHCMPPYSLWLSGPEDIRAWMHGPGHGCRGSRLLALDVCGQPGFAQYRRRPEGGHTPWALIVLELAGDRIRTVTNFLDTERLFPRFDLPSHLD